MLRVHHVEEKILVLFRPDVLSRVLQPDGYVALRGAWHNDWYEALVDALILHVLRLHTAMYVERVQGEIVVRRHPRPLWLHDVLEILWRDENKDTIGLQKSNQIILNKPAKILSFDLS